MSAAYNISGWWLLFGIAVYAVPLCVFLHERRWLRSLVSPALTMLRRCPFYMLVAVALLFGQMVVRGSIKTNRTNSVEIELGGGNGEDSFSSGRNGTTTVLQSWATNFCFTAISMDSNGMVAVALAWPQGLFGEVATLDLLAKVGSFTNEWEWIDSAVVNSTVSNIVFSIDTGGFAVDTNRSSAVFLKVADRKSNCSTMADWDGDGLPDVYEYHNGTNPYIPDAVLAPRLTVGSSGNYESIQEALAASTNYSVISLAPETFEETSPIKMPRHPVMLVCEDGYAVIKSHAPVGAFVFEDGQNGQTLLRGLYVVLNAQSSYQAAFWCGGNLPWSGTAATPSFEDIRIRALYPGVKYFGWHFYRYTNEAARISNFTMNASGTTDATPIYAYDGPPMDIRNGTLVNFGSDIAAYLNSSTDNYGGMADGTEVSLSGIALGESFANGQFLGRFGSGTNYAVAMRDCLMPATMETPHVPDVAEGLVITNSGLAWHGIALPESAVFNLGMGNILELDFFPTADTDGDGISDYDEVYVHETDPWLSDSDGDGISDYDEIANGSSPTDVYPMQRRLAVAITRRQIPLSVTNYLSWGFEDGAWTTNAFTAVTEPCSTNVSVFAAHGETIHVGCFCDLNRNGVYDSDVEMAQTAVFGPLVAEYNASFNFDTDSDYDGIPDYWEILYAAHSVSHTNRADATLDCDGDGLINLHEYWTGCCPTNSDGQTTLLSVLCRSVDERLAGKTPSIALPMYNNYPADWTLLSSRVNTNCWAYGLDFSCASPWNSASPNNQHAATAISRRHVILAAHHTPSIGTTYAFRGTNNIFCTRSFVASRSIGNDIVVGLLDSDLPPEVNPAKILPSDTGDYIKTGMRVPIISLDQEEMVHVFDLYNFCVYGVNTGVGVIDGVSVALLTSNATRGLFGKSPYIGGDSGNPCFVIIDNTLVLTHTLSLSNGFGPNLAVRKAEIQTAMDLLCSGYSIEEYDLSMFGKLP